MPSSPATPAEHRSAVVDLIRDAIAELNEELDYDHLRDVSETTVIFDGDEALDSLSLVSLIVDIEARVEESFDTEVVLASEKAMSMANSPYRNVGSLVEFVLGEMSAA
ncbi:MAG: hypothetical protein AAF515_04370 [Pseudomonadota bacterium]